jgi:hypothetical protein
MFSKWMHHLVNWSIDLGNFPNMKQLDKSRIWRVVNWPIDGSSNSCNMELERFRIWRVDSLQIDLCSSFNPLHFDKSRCLRNFNFPINGGIVSKFWQSFNLKCCRSDMFLNLSSKICSFEQFDKSNSCSLSNLLQIKVGNSTRFWQFFKSNTHK